MNRRTLVVLIAGLAGVASLAALPFEALVPGETGPFPIRLLALIQPAILVAVLALVGGGCAPRVGLSAPVVDALFARQPVWPALGRQLPAAVAIGAAVAALLLGYAQLAGPFFTTLESTIPAGLLDPPLITRLLYGGVAEEVLLRWGVMSLTVWLAWKALRGPVPSRAAFVVGLVVSSGLFAVGHLPVLFMMASEPPAWLIAAVLAGNAVPGLLCGWLYWRRGLEAAMIAHALAHLLAWAVGRLS